MIHDTIILRVDYELASQLNKTKRVGWKLMLNRTKINSHLNLEPTGHD